MPDHPARDDIGLLDRDRIVVTRITPTPKSVIR